MRALLERYPELTSCAALVVIVAFVGLVIAEPGRVVITLAYTLSVPVMLGLPAMMVVRHRLRQSLVMDRLRALYATAEALVMVGQRADARGKLASIERWERHWKIGNSALYRLAYGAAIMTCTFGAGFMHHVLYFNVSSQTNAKYAHKSFGDTLEAIRAHHDLIWWLAGLSMLAALGAIQHIRDMREEPWAAFYSAKLRSLLQAGRRLATTPQQSDERRRRRAEPRGEASARELLGLPAVFTPAELRRAWLRLVRELHPDRWAHAGEAVRGAKEAALKRVNAARDELELLAMP